MQEPEKYTAKQKNYRLILIFLLIPVLALGAWFGYNVYKHSSERAALKAESAEVNNIQYGLLSVDAWRDNIMQIVSDKVNDFSFSQEQEDTLKKVVNKVLYAMVDKAEGMINEKQHSFGAKLKKIAIKTFVNVDKIREKVPEFTQTIIDQLKDSKNRQSLIQLTQSKLTELTEETRDSMVAQSAYEKILIKYNVKDAAAFNTLQNDKIDLLQEKAYDNSYWLLGIMAFLIILWICLRKQNFLHAPLFIMSIILALILLMGGLSSPLLEIDARIKELNFLLIGKHIVFHDQVLFYQSKSIADIVRIMMEAGTADTMLVGILLLVFSILFPISKLISTLIYLFGGLNVKKNKIVNFFAFKSGKWSMADVMVVAIFMAYIAFNGILKSQLNILNINTPSVVSITTNETSIQPGLMLFVAFVLFGLLLSVILKGITSQPSSKDLERLKV